MTANNSSSSLISLKDGTLTSVDNPIVLKTAEASNGVNGLSPNDGSILYFTPGDNDKVNASIYALYPSTVTNIMTNFTVQTPQTSDDLYMLSDLMYASTSTAKTDQAIHLQFAHKMAKLVINATGEDNITMNKITLKKLYTTIDWTPSTGTLGSLSGEKTDIVIADQEVYASTLSGAALFPPQTKDDTYFAEVECKRIDGTTATAYFYIITKAFEEGKVYTVNMKIGIRNLNDDGIVTISPWPVTVGTINVEAVGNLGLAITSLADDGNNETNTMQGTGLSGYYTYNGKSCTPVPTVTDGKETGATTLTKGTDYEVSYYNNFNAGMALVVVTGKDGTEYEGLSTFTTYTIRKATNTMSYPNNNADYATNLSKDGIVQNMLVKPSNQTNEVYGQMTYKLYSDAALTTEYTDADPIATIDNNGNVYMKKKGGPIYVKATMDDTGNYEAKSVSYKLTITAGDVSQTITIEWNDGAAVGSETWPFTGLAVRPGFKIKDNGNTLAGSENSGGYDYNYTYGNNIQVGSGTSGPYVEITGQGEYAGTKRFYFSITKVDNSWATLNEPLVPIDCGATASSPRGGDITLALSLPAGTFEIGGRPKFGTGTN